MYNYYTPPGYGDTFFQYVFDAQSATPALVDGNNYLGQLGIPVQDGSFLVRQWSGLSTIANGLQIYDWLRRQFFSQMANLGSGDTAPGSGGYGQMVVLPEVEFPDSGNIRFDLGTVAQDVAGTDGGVTIYKSQLVFSGARRRKNWIGDPAPSSYRYYEKPFTYQYALSIDNYATVGGVFQPPVNQRVPVNDYDFELRRIELQLQSPGQSSQFKMLLYNNDKRQCSNLPVLSNLLCHTDPKLNSGELSFWPCPPVVYRIGSAISFDVFSLLISPLSLPQTFNMSFVGVRRIPC